MARIAARMWIATLGSRGFEVGSAAIEGEPLGCCRFAGKGGRVRTVPIPAWCKGLVDVWLRHSSVSEGKIAQTGSTTFTELQICTTSSNNLSDPNEAAYNRDVKGHGTFPEIPKTHLLSLPRFGKNFLSQ